MQERDEAQWITRREFLKKTVKLGVAAGLVSSFPRFAAPVWAVPRSERVDIAVVQGDSKRTVKAAVDALGGIGSFVRNRQRVVIKPDKIDRFVIISKAK